MIIKSDILFLKLNLLFSTDNDNCLYDAIFFRLLLMILCCGMTFDIVRIWTKPKPISITLFFSTVQLKASYVFYVTSLHSLLNKNQLCFPPNHKVSILSILIISFRCFPRLYFNYPCCTLNWFWVEKAGKAKNMFWERREISFRVLQNRKHSCFQ